MFQFAKFSKKKKTLIFMGVLLLISLLSFWRLLRPGYFSMQDDIQIFRLQQLDSCFKDGQIPCRYISEGGLGYGYPLYNFYPPLPYFIGEVFHLLGFSLINSVKLLFILGFIFSAQGMFLWSKKYWGNWGGLVSAVFYLFAPYHAVDSYVRGALGEFFALAILPFIFWLTNLALKKSDKKYRTWLCLLLAGLFLTHNLSTLIFLPIWVVYIVIVVFLGDNNLKKTRLLAFGKLLLCSFLISAFFLLPMVFEKKLVTVATMTRGFFDFRGHYVSLKQLFLSRDWGYGASLFGDNDDMSFQIGFFQWFIPVLTSLIILFFDKKKRFKHRLIFSLFMLFGFGGLFFTHNRSTFIWKLFPFMAYIQFPWRFLIVAILFFSFCAGAFVGLLKRVSKKTISLFLVSIVVLFNLNYFKEDIWFSNLSDQEKLTGEELVRQSGAGIRDYWPIYGETYPKSFAPSSPWFNSGEGSVVEFEKFSNRTEGVVAISSPVAEVVFPIVYFPNWSVWVGEEEVDYDLDPNLGLIRLPLSQGEHKIKMKFSNTPIRTVGNLLSLVTITFMLSNFGLEKWRKLKTKK